MKARYLKQSVLNELRKQVPANLTAYRKGSFGHLVADPTTHFEADFGCDEKGLATLVTADAEHDPENCAIVLQAFTSLSPYEARDERLWAYLTHTLLLDYTRTRWPIPTGDQEAVAFIRTHFFAKDKRSIERDNAISRLWWMAHLCQRVPGIPLEESLKILYFRTDVRANIVERPTISQNPQIFAALMKMLRASYHGDEQLFERAPFRRLMIELNSIGGVIPARLNIDTRPGTRSD